ncbi:MAG: metallophosphoesterase [Oscillospiraceae bacterium]|nr:metallophosphoesterase [Oscillospiraceae bacterium]
MIQGIKKRFKHRKLYIILAGLIILTGVFLFISVDHKLEVNYYTFETDKLEEPVRIAFIADLHSCSYGEEQIVLITAIVEANPDVIVMVGDIADDKISHTGTIELLEGIADRYPCFYVSGNHEFKRNKINEIKDIFREYGVVILDGRHEVIEINGQLLNIVGTDDPHVGKNNFEIQLERAFSEINEELFTLFLLHKPERFPQVSEYYFDLMLAGHAHGGQWRLPNILNGLYSPGQGLFPKYTSGFYTYNERAMLVSRGLGLESTPFVPRIFNPPELIILDIIPIEN